MGVENMSKMKILAGDISKVFIHHKATIKGLPSQGPKGGSNAKFIKGWKPSPNQTITKAFHIAGLNTLNYWSGTAPTPSQAIPECMYNDCCNLYKAVFNKKTCF
jgi:hypothetical protein